MAFKNKKEIPAKVLSIISPYLEKNSALYHRAKPSGDYLLKMVDSDTKSDFFFEISDFNVDTNGSVTFWILVKPDNPTNTGPRKSNIGSATLDQHFNVWAGQLAEYERLPDIFKVDDPILNQYQGEFFSEFEIIDEDAETNSFDFKRQLLIDRFLEQVYQKLEQEKRPDNATEIQEIQDDVIELRSQQTKWTKKKVVSSIGWIISKCRKGGFELGKWVLETFIKSVAETVTKIAIMGKIS